ncbi:hypothetical protein H072_7661 [Dactylellina haptotyla CBS 200.50]|uniref:Uncharacterized protein n=1 Tax=Dactylellina haptotyla (strain CBS 200.50) TaxID=1284197 RepID=S8A6R0_DACHA|nr:hypothetical protein H072_7661 [Dactylellina haptotyla CBS 200.50]
MELNPYILPPVGDPNYRPVHQIPPTLRYDSRTDCVLRLPTPETLPPLPLIDPPLYNRVFMASWVPWVSNLGEYSRNDLQVWGDEVFEWMIQCVLHQEYGYLVRDYFDGMHEAKVLKNLMCDDQIRYFSYLYDFDSRLLPKGTFTVLEKSKNLHDSFYAYIGAVETCRGPKITLKWLRDLIKPILEYYVSDITDTWPKNVYHDTTVAWERDIQGEYLHPDFQIGQVDYELFDCTWMARQENQALCGDHVEDICVGMLKVCFRNIIALLPHHSEDFDEDADVEAE